MAASENESFRGRAGSLPFEPIEEGELEPESSFLTDQELIVLTWIARGLANKQIAREMEISEQTVKNHVSSCLGKLGVNTRTQAALVFQRTVDICGSALEKDGDPEVMREGFLNTLKRVVQERDDKLSVVQARLFEVLERAAEIEKKEREEERKARAERWRKIRERAWNRRVTIVLGLAEGKSVNEIADALGTSGESTWSSISVLYKEFGIDRKDPRRRELLLERAGEAWDI